jgi:hypothetical protein
VTCFLDRRKLENSSFASRKYVLAQGTSCANIRLMIGLLSLSLWERTGLDKANRLPGVLSGAAQSSRSPLSEVLKRRWWSMRF